MKLSKKYFYFLKISCHLLLSWDTYKIGKRKIVLNLVEWTGDWFVARIE